MVLKILAAALAVSGAIWIAAPAPASAAPNNDGISTTAQTDLSAQRRHRRYRAVRTYRAPAYYGYYGPTYYDRPYYRPAPMPFGFGGWW